MNLLEAKNLYKSFGNINAVSDISISLNVGEVIGFLGPNGAGKSTTMKILTGFLEADSGSIEIKKIDLSKDPINAKSIIGYLPEGAEELYVPHENFNRAIGATKGQHFNVDGTPFEGSEEDYAAYLAEVLPTDQDELDLLELFKQEWIANKPMSTRQIESGIGASA